MWRFSRLLVLVTFFQHCHLFKASTEIYWFQICFTVFNYEIQLICVAKLAGCVKVSSQLLSRPMRDVLSPEETRHGCLVGGLVGIISVPGIKESHSRRRRSTVYNIQYTVYNIYFIVHSIHCTVHSVHCNNGEMFDAIHFYHIRKTGSGLQSGDV